MQTADDSMRAYYAARAPIYDEVYLRPERQADLAVLRAMVPAWFAGRSVLEVACGTGWWTQYIAPLAARMTATDAVVEPLEFARLRPGVGKVAFVQADAFALPDSLGTFDAAFAGLWISHVPVGRRRSFLTGLHARLSPGSTVIFVDNTEAQLARLPIAERDVAGDTYQLRTLPDGSTHRVLKNFPSEAELRALIDGIGVRVRHWSGGHFWAFRYELPDRQRASRPPQLSRAARG